MQRLKQPPASSPLSTGAAPRFDQVYQEQFPYVWHTLRRLGVRTSECEDLAHDVFVVVYRRLADYDATRPMRPWLFGIAYRVSSEHHRRRPLDRRQDGREVDAAELPDPRQSPERILVSKQARSQVARALEQLPLEQRAVFVLHDIDGIAVPEIARALELPLNTVYSRLRLGRARFSHAVVAAPEEGEKR